MIDCCQFAVFASDPRSVLARDPVIRRDDLLRGYSAETDDNSGAQQISFISEIRHAAVFLVLSGTAVAGRMTLQDIGDIDFLSGKPGMFQKTVKHASGRSDERNSLFVFPGAGRFGHKHDCRTAAASSDYGFSAGFRQPASSAAAYKVFNFLPAVHT